MKLRIQNRSQSEWLLTYIFVMPFAFSFLIDLLKFPSFIKYTLDLALILLMVLAYLNRIRVGNKHIAGVLWTAGAFLLITIVGFLLQRQSVVYYIWGLRNNMRFFLFFAICTLMLKREHADSCMRLMDSLFYINCIISLYQIFVLRLHQDRVGGIFGISKGCNAYTNIYFMIIGAWHILQYINKEESLRKCLIKCGLALIIAALIELKFFFIEVIAIVVVATLITKFSWRKLWIVAGSIVGVLVGVQLIIIMFPHFSDWFSLENILEYSASEQGYTATSDLNRLTAVAVSWNRFLETWPQKLFGLGLGSCDYSSNFAFLTTSFYERYKSLNYVWFSSAFLILETGLLGLSAYVYFFIRVYIAAGKVEKNAGQNVVYCQLARIMALMAPLLIVYNSSMRMECAYMFFFVLALPFLQQSAVDIRRR